MYLINFPYYFKIGRIFLRLNFRAIFKTDVNHFQVPVVKKAAAVSLYRCDHQ